MASVGHRRRRVKALGNTGPSPLSRPSRLLLFAAPAIGLSARPGFEFVQVWHLSVATVTLQALVSLRLLRVQFRARLGPLGQPAHATTGDGVPG